MNNPTRLAVTLWMLLTGWILAGPAPTDFEELHNVAKLRSFSSTNEIIAYFKQHSLSFDVLPVKEHTETYLCLASYPYSGMDTIDFYYFKNFAGKWRVQMLYFVFHPSDRELKIVERDQELILRNGTNVVLTLNVEPAALTKRVGDSHLTIADAIRLADEAAVEHGRNLNKFNRSEAQYENRKWMVFYEPKASRHPGDTLAIEVNDRTGEIGVVPGM